MSALISKLLQNSFRNQSMSIIQNKLFRLVLTAFIAVSAGNILSKIIELPLLGTITKPLLMPLLAACIYVKFNTAGIWTSKAKCLIAAILFGALGDVLLMSSKSGMFLAGMGSFFVGHLLYLSILPWPWSKGGKVPLPYSITILVALLAIMLQAGICLKVKGITGICLCIYASIYAFLVHSSIVATINKKDKHYAFAAAAFAIFAISDLLVAIGVFTEINIPLRGFYVMLTYVGAQTIIAFSLGGLFLDRTDAFRLEMPSKLAMRTICCPSTWNGRV